MSTKSKKGNDNSVVHPKATTEQLVVQKLENEILIYDLRANQAICLNQTAALVWQNCDGKSSVSKIVKKLEKKLGAPVSEELIMFAVSELKGKGCLKMARVYQINLKVYQEGK